MRVAKKATFLLFLVVAYVWPQGYGVMNWTGPGVAIVTASFTRPADANIYAANDVVGNTGAPAVLTFANACRVAGGSGYITKMRLFTSQSTNVALYRLQLYTTAPAAIADNAPFTLLLANQATRASYIDIGPASTEGVGSDAANGLNADVRLAFKCAAASTSLFGILETKIIFTPDNAQTYFLALAVDQY